MTPPEPASRRLAELRERMARAARLAGRDPADVTLIAVSKTQPPGAILPLIGKSDDMVSRARSLHEQLRKRHVVEYDDGGAIGRRYRRQDEIGTPLCVTVDFDSLEDNAVTIRERDTTEQIRVPISGLLDAVRDRIDALRPTVPSVDQIEV